jgi:uncharacterized membrane protein YkoI
MKVAWKKSLLALVLMLVISVANAMSLSQAIQKVKRDTGGKVLSAQTRVQGNREVHFVKVLTQDGRVRTVRVQGNPTKKKKQPNARSAG